MRLFDVHRFSLVNTVMEVALGKQEFFSEYIEELGMEGGGIYWIPDTAICRRELQCSTLFGGQEEGFVVEIDNKPAHVLGCRACCTL